MTDLPFSALMEALAREDPLAGETTRLAALLQDARALAAALKLLIADAELELAARMESDHVVVPGVGVLVRGYDERSQWRDEHSSELLRTDITEAIAKRLALDIGTGEVDQVKVNIAREALRVAWDVIPSFSSVKRPAGRLGIHIDDYRTITKVARVTIETDAWDREGIE